MKTGAGRLNRRVTIKKPDENATRGADGKLNLKTETNWRIVCKRWCQVVPRGGREFQRQQQIGEEITHLIRFRNDAESKTFKTTWKIQDGSKYYGLSGPAVEEYEDSNRAFYLLFPAIEQPAV